MKDSIPLLVPHSFRSTETNKTGSWRFLRPRYEEKTAPCSAACPAGEDIGRVEMLAAQGLFKEAWETILKENPLPAVCGRVCFRPCEGKCNRSEFDEGIGIHTIEGFLADTAARYDLKPSFERPELKKQRIAVVGAGPAGLSAAYFLARLGYGCDLFESSAEPGGILRYGIPAYRLPAAVLRIEIERIGREGVEIHCGKPVTKTFLEEIESKYDAVFLACGRSRGIDLPLAGEEAGGVEDGLQFLRKVSCGEASSFHNGQVAIIGGGNTAVDAARTVLRVGGKPLLIYRRRREDMPAFEEEIEMALEEGVELLELWTPIGIQQESGEYVLRLQQMQAILTAPGERTRVEPAVPQNIKELRVVQVLKAVGFEAAEEWYNPPAEDGAGVLRLANSVLVERPTVFAHLGDLSTPIKSVTHAIASGKEAAIALDILWQKGPDHVLPGLEACRVGNGPSLSMEMYMQGPRCARSSHVVLFSEINTDHFQFAPKIVRPRLLKEERARSFSEIDLRISAGMAMKEAERCFNCGLCNQCDNCRLYCPDLAVVCQYEPGERHIDYDYCKGCGICVVECPRNAMSLEKD
ncbi:MAG: FAD-dependent oxidoreductase [Syntrophobacteraceae bacterium]